MLTWKNLFNLVLLLAVVGILVVGCNRQPAPDPAGDTNGSQAGASGDENIPEGLANLPEADRAAAVKQATCPVSGRPLGSMGQPPKVVVNGREVFLCCPGCEEQLRAEPDKYLSKLSS